MYSALAVHEGALDLWHCVCIIRCVSVWTCPCVCEGGSGRRVRIYTETFQSFSWRRSCVFTPVTLKSNPIGFKDRGQCHPIAATVSLRQLLWSNIFSWHWLTPLKGQRNKRAKKTPRTFPETPQEPYLFEGNYTCFILELTDEEIKHLQYQSQILVCLFVCQSMYVILCMTYLSYSCMTYLVCQSMYVFFFFLKHLVSVLLPHFCWTHSA